MPDNRRTARDAAGPDAARDDDHPDRDHRHRHPHLPDQHAAGRMRPRWYRWVRRRVVMHPGFEVPWRLMILAVGSLILAAGVAMLVLPGPGWVTIFLGLAVMSWEYAWAERILDRARQRVRHAAERAMDPAVRRRNQGVAALLLVLTVAVAWWYAAAFGWPGPLFAFLYR